LRKQLKPYRDLKSLADALGLTIPALKKRIRELEENDELTLESLKEGVPASGATSEQETFELFHQFERCLVCGSPMRSPEKRDIGWGEFKQCATCQYSAHEMANYKTRRRSAEEQLTNLLEQARKTEIVLRAREQHSRELREKLLS